MLRRIDDLAVKFECVAASIEHATAHYFSTGLLVEAILASSAVPGMFPPVEIDGEHFLDGGLVSSIPLDRAIAHGATTIYMLQVGRVEAPLAPPSNPWEVAMVAFEISRRHRFTESMRNLRDKLPYTSCRPATRRRSTMSASTGGKLGVDPAPDRSVLCGLDQLPELDRTVKLHAVVLWPLPRRGVRYLASLTITRCSSSPPSSSRIGCPGSGGHSGCSVWPPVTCSSRWR